MTAWCYRCGSEREMVRLGAIEEEDGVPMAWSCPVCGSRFTDDRLTFIFDRLTPQPGEIRGTSGPLGTT